ncbi:DDE-type integrase/transposase/recombinase [Candidatus Odyssella thessalonicensis]|uniref:DDE-type integrase/transposase/recombinase n=1 Tax=Candidatus Odyssella thessalonicensis TaxID=84647 RepID=UPI000225AC93|nr:DDE-type integrase/transposase/recombinase [Candidatus Odyssella thessalonicensis]
MGGIKNEGETEEKSFGEVVVEIRGIRNGQFPLQILEKLLKQSEHRPSSITTDKHSSYHTTIEELKREGCLDEGVKHRQVKYLNNILEQDHRRIKCRTRLMRLSIV